MSEKIKKAIENYQCSGCVCGSDISCFEKVETGIGCGKQIAGTTILPGVGKIFLGMPKGFNRLGEYHKMKIQIYDTYENCEWKPNDQFNIAVWKHLDENGNTIIRGIMPRRNEPFIHIFLENCMDKIECKEITKEDIEGMD